MDKNTITGLILIAAVLFGYTWYNQPSQEEMEAQRVQDSIATVAKQNAEEQKKIAETARAATVMQAAQDSTSLFHNAMQGQAQDVILQNEKINLLER